MPKAERGFMPRETLEAMQNGSRVIKIARVPIEDIAAVFEKLPPEERIVMYAIASYNGELPEGLFDEQGFAAMHSLMARGLIQISNEGIMIALTRALFKASHTFDVNEYNRQVDKLDDTSGNIVGAAQA